MKVRYESFGGIIGLDKPPMLVFVNKEYMQKLGYSGSPAWSSNSARLQAPTEIHFAITNKCNQNCKHCYTSSGESEQDLTTAQVKKFIDDIAGMDVFHMALGGGESLLREDIFEIADYIRSKGLVPNLTTNGLVIDKAVAGKCRVFGQINVSIDGLSPDENQPRTASQLNAALTALKLLKEAKNRVGINYVVNRHNYSQIPELVKYARENKLADVEFLRFKPAGRATQIYKELCCTKEQHENFFPDIIKLAKKYRINLKIDCSYVPMVCCHKPDKKLMEKFHIRGCDGGNLLAASDAQGNLKSCSFASGTAGKISELRDAWKNSGHFLKFFDWQNNAPEPCKSCEYLSLCLGGCHVVAEHVTGNFQNPDPECPIVAKTSTK